MDTPPLTVGHLRALLAPYADEVLVKIEGCTCIGPAAGLEDWPYAKEPSVLITHA